MNFSFPYDPMLKNFLIENAVFDGGAEPVATYATPKNKKPLIVRLRYIYRGEEKIPKKDNR